MYALESKPDRHSPPESVNSTLGIRHISGKHNTSTNALSRLEVNALQPDKIIDVDALAEAQDTDDELKQLSVTSLKLTLVPLPKSQGTIVRDTSTGTARPFVPNLFVGRCSMYCMAYHTQVSGQRRHWSQHNLCDQVLTTIYTTGPKPVRSVYSAIVNAIRNHHLGTFSTPDLCSLVLTCVDRFTRWPKAIPISDITAETVTHAFITHWVARFGTPSTIATDRGRQFESRLLMALTNMSKNGCQRIRTTSYHPATNGLVERLHRQFKAPLKTHSDPRWTESLPLVLIGIRTAIKLD